MHSRTLPGGGGSEGGVGSEGWRKRRGRGGEQGTSLGRTKLGIRAPSFAKSSLRFRLGAKVTLEQKPRRSEFLSLG